jgi:hypothetical protein
MIPSVIEFIKFAFEDKVDMLQNFSLASVSVQKRYASLYEDFNIDNNYKKANDLATDFYFDYSVCLRMCENYKLQDKNAKRNAKNNVNINDFDKLKKMFLGNELINKPINYKEGECYCCHQKFNSIIKPTLDRLDNKKSHELNNVVPCCKVCNVRMSDREKSNEILKIQIHKFALINNLPFTIDNVKVYWLLRKGITGGIANVHHKYTKAGETKINKLEIKDGKIISKDTNNIITHIEADDANSLYERRQTGKKKVSI